MITGGAHKTFTTREVAYESRTEGSAGHNRSILRSAKADPDARFSRKR